MLNASRSFTGRYKNNLFFYRIGIVQVIIKMYFKQEKSRSRQLRYIVPGLKQKKKGFHKTGPVFVNSGSAYLTATTFSLPCRKV